MKKKVVLPDFDAVIFDMDGSLVDSMWMWKEIDKEYLGGLGIELPKDLQSKIEGMSFTETAQFMKKEFGIKDDIETMKKQWNQMAYEAYRTRVPYKKGALEFLKWCKVNGKKLGIATSNSRELVDNVGEVLKFPEFFDCIITSCEVKKGKPAPDVYLAVAEKLGVRPDRCIVFEDIAAGIMAGKNAGMTVIAVEDEYSAEMREKKKELADDYINDYTDLEY